MTAPANYDDVLNQLRAAGLIIDGVDIGRLVRCKVEGEGRDKKGWYWLHDWTGSAGDVFVVGSYGVWHGNDNTARQVDLKKRKLSNEEKSAIKARIAADKKKAAAQRRATAKRAQRRAENAWRQCSPDGESEYLKRKGVQAHGVRFSPQANLVIPIHDAAGCVHGLQVVYSDPAVKKKKGRDKDYWPSGLAKQGNFFLIGSPTWLVLVAEGYATAASLHEATGFPVAVAFDANNLQPVCQALKKRYRQTKILICADDDWLGKCRHCMKMTAMADPDCQHCGKEHGKTNTGVETSRAAAFAVDGAWMIPRFADRGTRKLTDFNDLHTEEGLHLVRSQVEAKIEELRWSAKNAASAPQQQGSGDDKTIKPIQTSEELLERFVLVYAHKQTVFDSKEHLLLSLADMRDVCTNRESHRRWMEDPTRRIVRINEVGFDPGSMDKEIKCNLWGGWPTSPKSGSCERLLELLEYLCSGEENSTTVYDWVLCWLAYPIQNPGAKMRTALVLHGPQGVGKNLFFESVMAIYGEYGRIVDQNAVEDKFTDWASKKLFLIADEVVARQELYHTKNKLKSFITSDWIRINPKNVTPYDERNHVNLVFLSNETQPLVLERDDRRHTVIWTPPELPLEIYKEVTEEIHSGGIEALHHHLLGLNLENFTQHTKPPMTKSKAELIDLGMDSTERFWRAWIGGDIEDVPVVPCKSGDFYQLYRDWSGRIGYSRHAPEPKLLAEIGKRSDCYKKTCRYWAGTKQKSARFIFPPNTNQPPEKNQVDWLTECIDAFNEGVKNWKGE